MPGLESHAIHFLTKWKTTNNFSFFGWNLISFYGKQETKITAMHLFFFFFEDMEPHLGLHPKCPTTRQHLAGNCSATSYAEGMPEKALMHFLRI